MDAYRNTFKIIFLGVFVLSFIFVLNSFNLSHYFPIKTVRVFGANRVDQKEIKNIITPLVDRGFFTVNVDYIKDRLLQLPWVFSVLVKRNWPDQIEIVLMEKKALAYWNKESLLSDVGELFTPRRASFPEHLPQFIGESGKQILMLKHYQEMHRLLIPLHVNISYLELTPYLTWKIKLDNGITLQVGHKDILTRLIRFVKVYDKIVGDHAEDVDYIDLRYSNGMAIRFREKAMA
jgi:cell division protein FtsQ